MAGVMNEYWLISAPGEKTPQNTFEKLNQALKSGNDKLSENFKFAIPDLKVKKPYPPFKEIKFSLNIMTLRKTNKSIFQ